MTVVPKARLIPSSLVLYNIYNEEDIHAPMSLWPKIGKTGKRK